MIKKKIMSMALSVTMIAGMLSGYGVDVKAATKSITNQVAALSDVSAAKVNGNINISYLGEDAAEGMSWDLRNIYFQGTDTNYWDDEGNISESGKNFIKVTDELGLTKGYDKDGYAIYADELNVSAKITSDIVTDENYTLDISGKIAKGPEKKFTTIKYNNGDVSIDLRALANALSAYTGITTREVYKALSIPVLNEISLNVYDNVNSLLDNNINPEIIKSFTVYTKEDGEEFADMIGQIKYVEYGDEMNPKFNITKEQFKSTVKTISALLVDLIDPILSGFEKQNGTTSTLTITNAEIPELLKKVGKTLQTNAEPVLKKAQSTIFALPGFDEIYKSYPAGYLEASNLGTVAKIKNVGQTIEQAGTEVTTKDENGNEITYVPITKLLESNTISVKAVLSADTKGEKGYRDATFKGTVDIYDAPNRKDEDGRPIVQTKLNVSYDFNIKENGKKPDTTNTTKPTNSGNKDTKPNVKLGKTKITVASKKKAAAKAKISFKKVKGAKKYQVQIATSKKFKKILVKKVVKKTTVTIKSKKIKNKKKLYVRVKAVGASKWSKAKKIRNSKNSKN